LTNPTLTLLRDKRKEPLVKARKFFMCNEGNPLYSR
jgi:hypothetical protein